MTVLEVKCIYVTKNQLPVAPNMYERSFVENSLINLADFFFFNFVCNYQDMVCTRENFGKSTGKFEICFGFVI